jgi:hypothetical protein
MKIIPLVSFFVLAITSRIIAEDFIIDDYDFYWRVAEVGERTLQVNKDQKTTKITISGGLGRSLRLTSTEAQAIGEALKNYVAVSKELKPGDSKEVAAGEFKVIFDNDEKYGFSAIVKSNERFSLDTISLDSKEIKTFLPHLLKAKELVNYVDSKIKP